jgi:uncharacterized protein involved in exopolysaccharide biosynthesis
MAWLETPLRPSQRRALVFVVAFLAAAVASLIYTFSRPAEYRAEARLHIVPTSLPSLPAVEGLAEPTAPSPHDAAPFLTEVQILTSRPLLTNVVQHLRDGGVLPYLGADPVTGVQRMLSVEPVTGTEVVVLSAEGTDRAFLPQLVNTVTDTYREHVADSYAANAASADAGLIDEEKSLALDMAAKQAIVDGYRKRFDIVSLERNENQVLAKLNGLNNAYNDANAKLAAATGQLEAARKSASQGEGASSAKDDPTLADLEQRASKIREQLQDLQRKFTPDYLALDSDVQTTRARLADLDQQIAARRVTSGQAAIGKAQEAYTSAKTEVDQLGREIADNQHDAQDFATHLSAYKALQQDLEHVEALHRNALDRLTQFQATTRQRAPEVEIMEAAATPREPVRPDYQTDAIVSIAGSLAFGLIAVLFGEFITGPAPSEGVTVRHTWMPSAIDYAGAGPPERAVAPPPRMVELPAPETPLRELTDAEVAALVKVGDDARLACVALLMGLTADELIALRWDAIDLGGNVIRIGGASARSFVIEEPLRGLIAARHRERPGDAATLLNDADGAPISSEELARLVLYAAYDAGLERPHEITPIVLRHTYLSFLLRQGMRMGDIGRIAGNIPQADLVAYMQIAGSSVRLPFEKIDRILPTLRGLAAA